MRSHYKLIGRYVRQVNARNEDLAITDLKGININKEFMPSVANTHDTDLSKYKVVSHEQFAYNPMHVGRDAVLPISMLDSEVPVIVSPAYVVFEIIDTNCLLPDYLMMWCRRPEFDRNAWFTTDSSVRGGFGWDDFCDMELPIPPIAKQREIVHEYNTIVNRIKLNEQLNQKLEETAQALYKHWFVDFEFPISAEYATAIGQPELEGQPYKSSGGEMVYNVELDREIPRDWHIKKMFDLCEIGSSRRIFESEYVEDGIPFYRGKEVILKKNGSPIRDGLFISKERYEEVKKKSGKPAKGDILLTAVGTLGVSYLVQEEEFYFKDGNVIWLKNFSSPIINLSFDKILGAMAE
jgi:type I restriction enzyme S subunit